MNIWILVFTNVQTERVLGPYTNIAVEEDAIVDLLTGNTIMHKAEIGWVLNISDVVIVARRIVMQSGSFTSPWGTRGQRGL